VRDELLKVAAQHFAQYGFKKTTLTDIASALGKQKTALYYYFKNKEDIFSEIIAIEADTLLNQLIAILENDENDVDKLRNYLIARITIMSEIAERYKILKEELFFLLPDIERVRKPYHEREVQALSKFLLEGKKRDIFAIHSPEQMASTIVNILKGLEIPMFIREEMDNAGEEVIGFVTLIMNGLIDKQELRVKSPLFN